MKHFTTFRIFQDPLEAEALIEVLKEHNIQFERSYEKASNGEDYIGSNPFDANIIIKIKEENVLRVEKLIKES